jgi:hypothetical protein
MITGFSQINLKGKGTMIPPPSYEFVDGQWIKRPEPVAAEKKNEPNESGAKSVAR